MSGREDHRKYDISISKFLNGLFTNFRGGVPALQKILLDARRNLRLPCEIDYFLDFFGGGGGGCQTDSKTGPTTKGAGAMLPTFWKPIELFSKNLCYDC